MPWPAMRKADEAGTSASSRKFLPPDRQSINPSHSCRLLSPGLWLLPDGRPCMVAWPGRQTKVGQTFCLPVFVSPALSYLGGCSSLPALPAFPSGFRVLSAVGNGLGLWMLRRLGMGRQNVCPTMVFCRHRGCRQIHGAWRRRHCSRHKSTARNSSSPALLRIPRGFRDELRRSFRAQCNPASSPGRCPGLR